jgi:hypothetical protein
LRRARELDAQQTLDPINRSAEADSRKAHNSARFERAQRKRTMT